MAKVELKGITKSFRGRRVLDSVSLSVGEKEFFCIAGRPAAGKTTLIRIIAGLEKPDSGSVYINGSDVTELEPAERNIAIFFENLALFPNKTGFENIAFPLRVRKMAESEIRRRVLEVAEMLRIQHILDRYPMTFSGGEQQRVALARTIVRGAEVYLLDEPLSNVDAVIRAHMRAEFKHLQALLGSTFIYCTHDPIEAMAIGDRICVLNEGKIEQIDTPDNIYNNPKTTFVAGFVGDPPMNFTNASIVEGKSKLIIEGTNLEIEAPPSLRRSSIEEGSNVLIGIRPEDLSLSLSEGDTNSWKGRVEFVELLGNEYVIQVFFDDRLALNILSGSYVELGKEVWVRVSPEKMHIFDSRSKQAII